MGICAHVSVGAGGDASHGKLQGDCGSADESREKPENGMIVIVLD